MNSIFENFIVGLICGTSAMLLLSFVLGLDDFTSGFFTAMCVIGGQRAYEQIKYSKTN